MTDENVAADPLVAATEVPEVSDLIADFQKCAPVQNGWHVLRHAEEVRFARWANQHMDGRKHSTREQEAKPWDGCSDARIFLADAQIREDVAVLVTAFWRALHSIAARGVEAGDDEQAARITSLLKWTLTRQKHELLREVELSAQYLLTYGVTCLNPRWVRELRYQWREFTLEMLQQAALAEQQQGAGPMAQLLMLVLDPAREEEAVAAVQEQAQGMVRMAAEAVIGKDLAEDLLEGYALSPKKARKVVRDLRREGRAELPLPYVCKNDPCISALKVFHDVFFRTDTTDLQAARIYHVEWLTEMQVKQRARAEGWNEAWVERAIKAKGKRSTWATEDGNDTSLASEWKFNISDEDESDLIEVIHAFYVALDEDGISCPMHTVFNACIEMKLSGVSGQRSEAGEETYALHEMMRYEHGQLPYVVGSVEHVSRRIIDSRGYPEILSTRQREVKVQRDALIDATSLSVVPPINLSPAMMDANYVFGPGAQNTVPRGAEPTFLEVKAPGAPVAFDLMEVVRNEVDQEFGSLSEKVNPVRSQTKKQMLINTFLRMWSEALSQQFALMQQFTTAEEFERITGGTQPMAQGMSLSRSYDVQLAFDARELDMEHMKMQGEVMQALFAVDRNGIMDTDRFVSHGLRALNPSLADEIIDNSKVGATEKIYREVQDDLLKMMGGFQPKRLVDADPTAPARLKFAQEIAAQNPKIAQAMQTDAQFAALVQEYVKNLEFAAQQSENRVVGRTGVK